LKERKQEQGVENLLLTGYQPFAQLPDVLGSADILVAILEPEAGIFSVPSKVLSYLCAQRPVLLAVPPENLAARIVSKSKAGLVVHPADEDAFVAAADTLVQNAGLRQQYAANALAYAVEHFDINRIGDRFERIITNEDSPTGC
jgi:glycosyltransferase involved in cell wall biosynthesis